MFYEGEFLISLIFTLIIEISVLFIMLKFFFKKEYKKVSWQSLFFLGFLCSFATLPYLWFVIPFFIHSRILYVLFGELFVFLIEAIIIHFFLKTKLKKAIIISFICNLFSFVLGLLLL